MDHTYTLNKIPLTRLHESPVLRGTHFLELFAALPFRANALDELPEQVILDYLYRHPIVVVEKKNKKKIKENETGDDSSYFVTGNLRSAALISCLNRETEIPVLVESPPIPIEIFLTEVIERELLNLSLTAMQTGGYPKTIASLFFFMKRNGSSSSMFQTKSRLSLISGVNRRDL